MTPTTFANRCAAGPLARTFATLLLACAATAGFAQAPPEEADPPGRVGRVTHTEGAVSFAEAGRNDWTNALHNRPLTGGDRLWVDRNARSELHVGSSAVRLGALTNLEITALDDQATQFNLTQGSLSVRIREMAAGERFEVGTPNLALALTQPGEYRIDVNPAGDTTRVAVHSGSAVVYGENRESASFSAGQQMSFSGRNLAPAAPNAWLQRDAFDQWAAARDRMEDESVTARYVSRDVIGYQQLDQHGEWRNDAALGPVWIPRVTVADWAPYRYGQWSWIAPWGWTWIDDAPWGFAPSHYGRWAQVGARWAWVPGPRTHRPVYAPALVAFVGGNSGGDVNWSISLGSGGPGVAWFPLGPGDAWRPGYRASRRYIDNANRFADTRPGRGGHFEHQRRPGAVTAVNADDFGRGRPGRGFQRVPDGELSRARVVDPPPTPGRNFGNRDRPAPPRAMPPTAVLNQPAPPAAAQPPQRPEQARQEQRQRDQEQRMRAWQERGLGDQGLRQQQQQRQAMEQQQQRQAMEQQERTRREQREQQERLPRQQAQPPRAMPERVQPPAPQARQEQQARPEPPVRREPQARPQVQDRPQPEQRQPRAEGPRRDRPEGRQDRADRPDRPERAGRFERGPNRD